MMSSKVTNRNSKLVHFFARRYLFSKKSHSLINTISIISTMSVAVPVAALIVLLSVFGGLDLLVRQLDSSFDAKLKISSADGRYFNPDSLIAKLKEIKEIEYVSSCFEDNALAKYDNKQVLVTVRGVDTLYRKVVPIESMIRMGNYSLEHGDLNYAVMGMGVAYNLGVTLNRNMPLMLYVPTQEKETFLPVPSYRSAKLIISSIFVVDAQVDGRYVLTSLKFAQQLFQRTNEVSFLSVKSSLSDVAEEKLLRSIVGEGYKVQNQYEQNEVVYKIMQNEKRVIFLISMFVIVIASFSLAGALIMLMTDKKEQLSTLKVMGCSDGFVDKIFFVQGVYISLIGIIIGVVLGVGITLAQKFFGFVKIDSQTMLIDSYPVVLSLLDVLHVVVCVVIINFLITFVTVKSRAK